MKRTLRPLAAFALVTLISLISAGCGSNTPSETGTDSSAGTGGTKKLTARDRRTRRPLLVRERQPASPPTRSRENESANGRPAP